MHAFAQPASAAAKGTNQKRSNTRQAGAAAGPFTAVNAAVPGLSRRFSRDNLHIRLEGPLTPAQAGGIAGLLEQHAAACGRIFIDVQRVTELAENAAAVLQATLRRCPHPERMFFKGRHGFSLAADGNKVLVLPERKHRCCGNCAECTCRNKHKAS